MNLFLVLSALFNEASPTSGLGMPDTEMEQMMSIARQLTPKKPIRCVQDWVIVEFSTESEQDADLMESKGVQSKFLFSLNVIYDQTGTIPEGGYVRTTLLKKLSNDCIFETRNTLYIMIGEGKHLSLSQQEVINIFSLV